jgi:predicted Zn-dependent protease
MEEIGSSVAASQGGVAGFASAAVLKAGKTVYTRGLDKNDEYEADRMGVVIATRAGYSPYGLVGVLQTLSAEQESKGLALMTKTHPNASDRIVRLDQAMGTKLDNIDPVADDLPTFVALRSPSSGATAKPAVAK